MDIFETVASWIPSTAMLSEILDWALIALFVGGTLFFVFYFIRYNVKVVVREKLGDVGQRSREFAARIAYTPEKVPQLKFFNGLEIKMPKREFITNHNGVRFKYLVEFYKTGETPNDLKPLKPGVSMSAINPEITKNDPGLNLEAYDSEVLLWNVQKHKAKREKYNTMKWWHYVLPYAAIGLVVVILFGSYFTIFEDVKIMHAESVNLIKQHDEKMLETVKIMDRWKARELESAMQPAESQPEVSPQDGG